MVNAVPLHERNDRGTTTFNACPLSNIPSLNVTIVPNPIVPRKTVAFSIFATLNNKVTAGTTKLEIEFADSTGQKIVNDVYFQVFTEPFDAGTTVSITAPSVPAPDELPDVYTIGVAIGDPVHNPITPLNIFGCAYAVVGSTSSDISSFPFTAISA